MSKVMIVDDEPEIRLLTKMLLEKARYKVVEAEDGKSALGAIHREKPDLVLLDVIMPGALGWEICKALKEDLSTRGIPLVMFTVRSMEDDKKRSMECGADAHISKPFEKTELLGTVDKLMTKLSMVK